LTAPSTPGSAPGSTQPARLYTEAEALAAVEVGIDAALAKAVPLAVQAAVAEKAGIIAGKDYRLELLTQALADSVEREKTAARKLAAAYAAATWGAVGACVLASAAFVFGAYVGLNLGP
jgi:uncharacterized membrane protein YqgA involved in biofilm formation